MQTHSGWTWVTISSKYLAIHCALYSKQHPSVWVCRYGVGRFELFSQWGNFETWVSGGWSAIWTNRGTRLFRSNFMLKYLNIHQMLILSTSDSHLSYSHAVPDTRQIDILLSRGTWGLEFNPDRDPAKRNQTKPIDPHTTDMMHRRPLEHLIDTRLGILSDYAEPIEMTGPQKIYYSSSRRKLLNGWTNSSTRPFRQKVSRTWT